MLHKKGDSEIFQSFQKLSNLLEFCLVRCLLMEQARLWDPKNIRRPLRDHSSVTSAKRWVGGVRKWQFLQIYSTIYAYIGGWS